MRRLVRVLVTLIAMSGMVACATSDRHSLSIANIPALKLAGDTITAEEILAAGKAPDIATVTPEITVYFDSLVEGNGDREYRAKLIRDLLLSPAFFDLEYERRFNFTAQETFNVRAGNCISFANLYIALARHYGLDANYQLLYKYPQWARDGNLVFMDIHVNASVKISAGDRLVIDVNQRALERDSRQIGRPKIISDDVATALFYSNLGVREFAAGNVGDAYKYFVWALEKAPNQYFTWSNLGPIFRKNKQLKAAEYAYLTALKLNPDAYSVVNNLAVLYDDMGRKNDFQRFFKKTIALRQKNPYFYYHLALVSKDEGDYSQAMEYVRKAIKLKDDEPDFYELVDNLSVYLEQLAINDVN